MQQVRNRKQQLRNRKQQVRNRQLQTGTFRRTIRTYGKHGPLLVPSCVPSCGHRKKEEETMFHIESHRFNETTSSGYISSCSCEPSRKRRKRMRRPTRVPSEQKVAEISQLIVQAIGPGGSVDDLREHGNSNVFLVPSSKNPHHSYKVHLTHSDQRNSCKCVAHERRYSRPCKHVIALKRMLGH